MASSPRVSAVVVSWNRADDLRLCLEALVATGWSDLEIVVVDNASSDDAAEVAARVPGVRVIRNDRNLGFAEAVDQGLAASTGAYVALVNNDAVVEPGWIAGMVARLEARPELAAVGGRVFVWDDENPLGDRRNRFWTFSTVDPRSGMTRAHLDAPDEEREVATLSGALVMVRRAAIDDVGAPFLEPLFFTYYEETDFFARAVRKGWKLLYVADPVGWHRLSPDGGRDPYRYHFHMERNRLLFAWRNFPDDVLASLVRATRRDAFELAKDHPVGLLGGRDAELRARRDAWLWAVKHRGELARQRAATLGDGRRYDEVVDAIEARAVYYGHARPEVAALVPPGARHVVDVGCASGALGGALKRARRDLEVRGIEPVREQAERARRLLDDVLVGGAEDELPAGWPRPDCVIFADVLEHLVDPWTVLNKWRERLAPGGSLIVSIPNVGHRSVVGGLLRGDFRYEPAGILDRTHLRFFTQKTALELVTSAGFRVEHVGRVGDERPAAAVARAARRLLGERTPGVIEWAAESGTVQFLVRAERLG